MSVEQSVQLPDPEKTYLEEQSVFFDAHPELIRGPYLNNFHSNLPGSPMRQFALENIPSSMFDPGEFAHLHSERRKGKTKSEFFADVENVLKGAGYDLNEVSAVVSEGASKLMPEADQTVWAEKLIPYYRALRAAGYSHYDLIQ